MLYLAIVCIFVDFLLIYNKKKFPQKMEIILLSSEVDKVKSCVLMEQIILLHIIPGQ